MTCGRKKLRTLLTDTGNRLGHSGGQSSPRLRRTLFTTASRRRRRVLGEAIVIAWPSLTSKPWEGLPKGRRIRISEEDIELVRKSAVGLGAISSEYSDTLKLKLGRKTLAVEVSGVSPVFGAMRNMIPQQGGRFLNPLDEQKKRRVAFLGNELAEQLFGAGDPVGQALRIHGSPFTVIGVLKAKEQDSSYSGRDKDKVIIPGSTFRALTGQEYIDLFIVTAENVQGTEQLTAEVLRVLAGRHRFDPEDKEALMIWDTTEMFKFLDTFMLAFKLFLGIVGSLTLVRGRDRGFQHHERDRRGAHSRGWHQDGPGRPPARNPRSIPRRDRNHHRRGRGLGLALHGRNMRSLPYAGPGRVCRQSDRLPGLWGG